MHPLVPDSEKTNAADLRDWEAFCLAYYEPIRRALRLLRVPEGEVDELANTFIVKVADKKFLDVFHAFQQREAKEGREAKFRNYLYRSLDHHVKDAHRRTSRAKEHGLTAELAEALEAPPERVLDPDSIWALDILHQALQALRRHCERTGKPHLWVVFEERFLADEFRDRQAKTRAELLAEFQRDDPQFLDNALTTAKRAFRRFVQELMPRWPGDDREPAERFAEWMEILRNSNASQFNLLHVAYRVIPFLGGDSSHVESAALVVYEEPALVLDDDELSLLLSLRLEMPLAQWLEVSELKQYVPAGSAFNPGPKVRAGGGASHGSPAPEHPLCLLTLLAPTDSELEALRGINVIGLLTRLKSLAKRLHRRTDHAVPEIFAELIYTMVSVRAAVQYQTAIHSIGPESLATNVRWFLAKSWLDDRIRPLLEKGLAALERSPDAAS
jgi:DNA-directed RNA polymerase specialized sigma24 family protein